MQNMKPSAHVLIILSIVILCIYVKCYFIKLPFCNGLTDTVMGSS